ncbi:hypothetical protein OKW38_000175 [Paraburkholderia sp. MM5496-R1]|uniref:Uncharacterized protein n=1 Tax=Paraburkholderia tuberum TaxID=157910 RepID=A0A1H1KEB0_9BURK|nr:hypothetical protein SAMN05445850_7138 [Paraburkholderia tuberum]
MNHGANGRQPLHAEHDVKERMQVGRSHDESRKVASHPVSNWAWATAHGHYDWMDSHVPFASLD